MDALLPFRRNRSKTDTRLTIGQEMEDAKDEPCVYFDAGRRLTSRCALEHCVQAERIILLFPKSKVPIEGGHGRSASGCSLCLAATPQESQIHVHRDGDAGGGDVCEQHRF